MSDASVIIPTPAVSEPAVTAAPGATPADVAATGTAPTSGVFAAPGAAAPKVTPAPTIDPSQFVTKADLASVLSDFLGDIKEAVESRQPAAAVALVAGPPVHLSAEDAPKVGDIVSYLGKPAQVLHVVETQRTDTLGNIWDQVMLHVGVFVQEHTLDAEDVQKA